MGWRRDGIVSEIHPDTQEDAPGLEKHNAFAEGDTTPARDQVLDPGRSLVIGHVENVEE